MYTNICTMKDIHRPDVFVPAGYVIEVLMSSLENGDKFIPARYEGVEFVVSRDSVVWI